MPKPPETVTPLPMAVNLGVVLDMPFLHQVSMPVSMATVVESTLLPTRFGLSNTTYQFAAPGQPLKAVYEAATSRKETTYHYEPGDPEAMARELEARIAELEARAEASRDPAERARLRDLGRLYRETLATLRARAVVGQAPMRIARQTWVEKGVGKATVRGEIVFEYAGLDIANGHMTTRTDDDPPRVDKLTRSYRYDALGRLAAMEVAGSVTEFTYDPGGRLVMSANDYVSPAGDFRCADQVVYVYAPPPGADPVAANALLLSVDDACSGPLDSFEGPPTDSVDPPPLEAPPVPEAEPPTLEAPLGTPSLDDPDATQLPGLSIPDPDATQLPGLALSDPDATVIARASIPGVDAPAVDAPQARPPSVATSQPPGPEPPIPGMRPGLAQALRQLDAGLDLPSLAAALADTAAAEASPPAPAAQASPAGPGFPRSIHDVTTVIAVQPPPPLAALPATPRAAPPEIPAHALRRGRGARLPAHADAEAPSPPATPGLPALELPKPDRGEDVTRVVNTYVYGPA